jgi:hypothetical protein
MEGHCLAPPDKEHFYFITQGIHKWYDEFKTGEIAAKIYAILVLFSNYQFAFLYCQILVNHYFNTAYHMAQTLINIMHIHQDYLHVYDIAACLIQLGGDKYLDEVACMVTSGLYVRSTQKVLAQTHIGQLIQPTPRALHWTKLKDLIEGIQFYHLQLTRDMKQISLDPVYNISSYTNQLIYKLDKMKNYNLNYIKQCVHIMENGGTLGGINHPKLTLHNIHIAQDKHVTINGTYYCLHPGNLMHPY